MTGDEDVPRTEGTEPQLVAPEGTGHYHQVVTEGPKPVWVRLDSLCVRDPGQPRRTNGSGIDMTGEQPGLLSRWVPAASGDWMAVVTFSVPYADGRHPMLLRDQLIPGYAVRPRGDRDPTARPAGL